MLFKQLFLDCVLTFGNMPICRPGPANMLCAKLANVFCAKPNKAEVDDAANQYPAVVADMDDLLVYLKSKGTRSLIDKADIEVSADLSDFFLVIVPGSSNDVSTVVRSLPDQPAN